VRHEVRIPIICPRCGAATERACFAEARSAGLRVFCSVHCPACSLWEEGDGDELPDLVRDAFVAMGGRWTARVREIGPRRADVVRAVRRLRNEGLAEVVGLLRRGEAVVEGALVEAEQVKLVLTDLGASVTLSRQG
jgi:hypothetical protein